MRSLPHLVTPAWLAAHQQEPDLRIVDVRWKLGDPGAGRRAYEAGHLPGAAFLELDRDLAAPRGAGPGRHPLPRAEDFARTMERIGVGNTTRVVAYDAAGGADAARLWFLLRYFGHETGAVLDGGVQAWQAAGGPLTREVPALAAPPGGFHARPRPELVVDRSRVAALARDARALVLDARAPGRYRGQHEPIDPRAGHIPGARNAPFLENLATAAGPFLAPETLRARYDTLGASKATEIVCYCGSGVTACHDLLALALLGRENARLYEGSWSDWSFHPEAALATGDE